VSVGKGVKVTKPVSEVISKGTGGVVQKDKYALFQVDVVNGATGKTAVSTYTQAPLSKQMSSTAFFASLVNAMVGQPKGSRIAVAAPVKSVWGTQDESSIGLKSADTAVFVIDILSVEPTDVLNAPGGTTVAPPASADDPLLEVLAAGPVDLDGLAQRAGGDRAAVRTRLVGLLLHGRIRETGDGRYARV
jgi:hypothetical protein